tara:strand:- start:17338 stop:18063 length:726 start_codon:yes stop_codon:yes gene_type:complete
MSELKFPSHNDCTNCDLCEVTPKVGHPTVQITHKSKPFKDKCIIFLGHAPNYFASQENTPFTGRLSNILWKAYAEGGNLTDKATIFFSSMVRCAPDKETKVKNSQYRECYRYTFEDLITTNLMWKDIAVVLLGAPAVQSFYKFILGIPKMSLKKAFLENGASYQIKNNKCVINVFSTFHPTACIFDHNHINSVESHMAMVRDWLDNTSPQSTAPHWIRSMSPAKYVTINPEDYTIDYQPGH